MGVVDEVEAHPPGGDYGRPIGLGRPESMDDLRDCPCCRSWFLPETRDDIVCPICDSASPAIDFPGHPGLTLRVLPVDGLILLEVGHPPRAVVTHYYLRGLHLRVVGEGPHRDLLLPAGLPPGLLVVVHRLTHRPITRFYVVPPHP